VRKTESLLIKKEVDMRVFITSVLGLSILGLSLFLPKACEADVGASTVAFNVSSLSITNNSTENLYVTYSVITDTTVDWHTVAIQPNIIDGKEYTTLDLGLGNSFSISINGMPPSEKVIIDFSPSRVLGVLNKDKE